MAFLKRLFGRQKKVVEPMHGLGPIQTEAEKDTTRLRMEAEMDSQREQRADSAGTEPHDNQPGATP